MEYIRSQATVQDVLTMLYDALSRAARYTLVLQMVTLSLLFKFYCYLHLFLCFSFSFFLNLFHSIKMYAKVLWDHYPSKTYRYSMIKHKIDLRIDIRPKYPYLVI